MASNALRAVVCLSRDGMEFHHNRITGSEGIPVLALHIARHRHAEQKALDRANSRGYSRQTKKGPESDLGKPLIGVSPVLAHYHEARGLMAVVGLWFIFTLTIRQRRFNVGRIQVLQTLMNHLSSQRESRACRILSV